MKLDFPSNDSKSPREFLGTSLRSGGIKTGKCEEAGRVTAV